MLKTSLSAGFTLGLAVITTTVPTASHACGGFFCTTVPINQAAEQILFRQQGDTVTAMVRIQYSGNAEDFSWVVPVPDTPEISVGSDLTFNDLDRATQPLFALQQEGNVCSQDQITLPPVFAVADTAESSPAESGVVVEEELTVGPFDIDIVSSDNPDDLAIWLADNDYLITDRGSELIAPYVNEGMKFVAVRLRSGETSGSIQPIILKYASERPAVPIRLTAVAAEDDMGVLVWVVNDQEGRAIPENYLHVIPNYTRLDWFNGTFNAYGSYQSLVTDAMNESGGQGFATDFAGTIDQNITDFVTDPSFVDNNLAFLDAIGNDSEFVTQSLFVSTNFNAALAELESVLPLRDGFEQNIYFEPSTLASIYTADELATARVTMREYLVVREQEPLQNSVDLIPSGAYLTRLFTTLSADEMTLDPRFNYNSTMPDQSRLRQATVNASCDNGVSNWTLTLGEGTGRDGEVVMDVSGQPIPGFGLPAPIALDDQPATFARQRTFADAAPETDFQANLTPFVLNADGSVEETGFVEGEGEMTDVGGSTGGTGNGTGTEGEGGVIDGAVDVVSESGGSSGGFGGTGPGALVLLGLVLLRRRFAALARR